MPKLLQVSIYKQILKILCLTQFPKSDQIYNFFSGWRKGFLNKISSFFSIFFMRQNSNKFINKYFNPFFKIVKLISTSLDNESLISDSVILYRNWTFTLFLIWETISNTGCFTINLWQTIKLSMSHLHYLRNAQLFLWPLKNLYLLTFTK